MPRLQSHIVVSAYMRRLQSKADGVFLLQKGELQAGAIYIVVNHLNGLAQAYVPVPYGLGKLDERTWYTALGEEPQDEKIINDYMAKQKQFDGDLWHIEVEDRAGRHFLEDCVVKL